MSKANAIKMLNHWILAGKSEGLRPGTSDLAVIVAELEDTSNLPPQDYCP
jgi:hypothetical protein